MRSEKSLEEQALITTAMNCMYILALILCLVTTSQVYGGSLDRRVACTTCPPVYSVLGVTLGNTATTMRPQCFNIASPCTESPCQADNAQCITGCMCTAICVYSTQLLPWNSAPDGLLCRYPY
ncbi:uncharacterized protein LOC106156140 [Lingula anatina]|uniref:Uncharacterized protein LOC106156140 n=1 Tax=Lingula anatina TaxID=7574 RepID=A0A1S3HKR7_LINAN|nr:uncharacterized protein LOC106156140 [Lingula anatina]|eukprot:XP_013386705.1 uncharacterized protein LOC106156140 [Lingula anatina]